MTAGSAGTGILAVDDSATIRTLVRDLLEGCGYRVLTAADGGEAVRVFREHHGSIAVVILDEEMPLMSGHETLRVLRAIDPGVRALCLSGSVPLGDGRGPEFQGFIRKPFKVAALLAEVERLSGGPRP